MKLLKYTCILSIMIFFITLSCKKDNHISSDEKWMLTSYLWKYNGDTTYPSPGRISARGEPFFDGTCDTGYEIMTLDEEKVYYSSTCPNSNFIESFYYKLTNDSFTIYYANYSPANEYSILTKTDKELILHEVYDIIPTNPITVRTVDSYYQRVK